MAARRPDTTSRDLRDHATTSDQMPEFSLRTGVSRHAKSENAKSTQIRFAKTRVEHSIGATQVFDFDVESQSGYHKLSSVLRIKGEWCGKVDTAQVHLHPSQPQSLSSLPPSVTTMSNCRTIPDSLAQRIQSNNDPEKIPTDASPPPIVATLPAEADSGSIEQDESLQVKQSQ
jgi:hypothetical protein